MRDADNLDEIGILNFWRMAAYAGKHHRDARESMEYYYAFERENKIEKMKGLFFDYSRQVCKKRMAEMDELMERFREVALSGEADLNKK